jgi:hypothetical protein
LRELGSCLRLPIADSSPARQRPQVGLIWASGQFLDRHVLEREYRRKSLLGPPLQSLLNALATRPLDLVALQGGLPVWILLPWAAEARWQRGRSDTPWYPSMHLLRQPANNDWYGLVRLLLAQLDLWLTSRLNSAS